MYQLTFADHLFAGLFALLSLGLARGKLPEGEVKPRRDFYVSAIASSVVLSGAVLALWVANGRPLEEFGLFGWMQEPRSTMLPAGGWLVLLALWVTLVKRGFVREAMTRIYRRLSAIMPSNRRELAGSWVGSAFAGCGEEIVYRGFLLWYAVTVAGPTGGLLLSSLLFGAAHGYQSRWGMIFATLAGLVLGAMYLASGSLVLVMWAHATYNMASFYLATLLLCRTDANRS